jgi:hypothetical protein
MYVNIKTLDGKSTMVVFSPTDHVQATFQLYPQLAGVRRLVAQGQVVWTSEANVVWAEVEQRSGPLCQLVCLHGIRYTTS